MSLLQEAGVPVPKFGVAKTAAEAKQIAKVCSWPFEPILVILSFKIIKKIWLLENQNFTLKWLVKEGQHII